jgi:fumarylacetoacetase
MPTASTDPSLASFIDVPETHPFPIQNLPYGVFRPHAHASPRVGVAIGDFVLDLAVLEAEGFFEDATLRKEQPFSEGALNAFMALGASTWDQARATITHLLRHDTSRLRDNEALRQRALHAMEDVELVMPALVGDYTDFYSSKEHATNVGSMFRDPENALKPNWLHLPVGYHGRASSVILSGRDVRRPCGQLKPDDGPPQHGPSRLLDFELEMGFFVGPGNTLGTPIPVDEAESHIFGMVLVNDWSARDIQKWEYEPLGPFLGKSFATTISPWVVPLAALAPFRCAGPPQDPEPLPYLRSTGSRCFDIHLEVGLRTPQMDAPYTICQSNTRHLYWDVRQQLAHHTVNGCNVRPGDLMASGTISGSTPDSYGSLLELTWRGENPITLPSGETRTFIEDGDRITMRAWAQGDGYRVGFGAATGQVQPAPC